MNGNGSIGGYNSEGRGTRSRPSERWTTVLPLRATISAHVFNMIPCKPRGYKLLSILFQLGALAEGRSGDGSRTAYTPTIVDPVADGSTIIPLMSGGTRTTFPGRPSTRIDLFRCSGPTCSPG